MNQLIFELIAEELPNLTGSELKAVIAIYNSGKWLSSSEMMTETGMSRKTCLKVMESPSVRKALEAVRKNPEKDQLQSILSQLRREVAKMPQQPNIYPPG